MLFFLISCLSFLLLSHSSSKMKTTFPWIFREFMLLLIQKRKIFTHLFPASENFPPIRRIRFDEIQDKTQGISLLHLPDLALDIILEKLSPVELCQMAGVCSSMREKCASNHIWEKKLMTQKWGGVLGDSAYAEWQSQIAPPKFLSIEFGLLSALLGLFGLNSGSLKKVKSYSPLHSVRSYYLALESGKFWFPAQVFNRENGHIGFMLSCYDAHLSYDSTTDNFIARYKANGRSMIEEGIDWKRIRAPSVNTPANVLHISDCLDELKPGDHIEIQWRKNKQFPFGWWYGVVGHLDSCNCNEYSCSCHINDTVILEFNQYSPESRWRKAAISRREHREVGDETGGFYGGIRKVSKKEEIEKWEQLWPNCPLQ
ncbi:hypothetical protein ACS0TY_024795 [Phlomoides rotata]